MTIEENKWKVFTRLIVKKCVIDTGFKILSRFYWLACKHG